MRKTKIVEIPGHPSGTDNRDGGKRYQLTEMPARQAEEWVIKAFLAISSSGVEVSEEAKANGAAGVITEGMAGFLRMKPQDAMPLLDDMMQCVQIWDTTHKGYRDIMSDDDIEEIATRFMLRAEVVELHTGFPVTAALSTLGTAAKRSMVQSDTPTSPSASEPSSAAA
jgi:hypothetical protein